MAVLFTKRPFSIRWPKRVPSLPMRMQPVRFVPSRASILTGKYPSRINVSYISGTTGPKVPVINFWLRNRTGLLPIKKHPSPKPFGHINTKPYISESGICKIIQTRELLISLKNMGLISILPGSGWDSPARIIFLIRVKNTQVPLCRGWRMGRKVII